MTDRQRKWTAATAVLVFVMGLAVSASAQQDQQQTQQNQQTQQQQEPQQNQQQNQQTQPQAQGTQQQTAEQVQTGLENQLTGVEDLQVTFEDGTLSLSGTVASQEQKTLAEEIAQNVEGVDNVQNNLRVRGEPQAGQPQATTEQRQPTGQQQFMTEQRQQAGQPQAAAQPGQQRLQQQPRESRLAREVKSRLQQSGVADPDGFVINTREGRAVIFGRVDTQQKKEQITQAARQVSGVDEVDNRVIVSAEAAPRNDAALKEAIEEQLYWSWFVNAEDIDVEVQNGTAQLSGVVRGWGELNATIENAYEAGAQRVATNLRIAGQQIETQPGFAPAADRQRVPADAQQGMRGDMERYDGDGAYSGGAWYDGARPRTYPEERQPAQGRFQPAQDRYYERPDREPTDPARARQAYDRQRDMNQARQETQLRRQTAERLRQQNVPGAEDLYVGYRDGVVILYGNVDDRETRQRVGEAVRDLPGVNRVDNRIRVLRERQPRKPDAQIREDIRELQQLSWFVDGESIDLDVDNAVVTLTGTVDSWGEMNEAILTAFQGGARRVINHLRIAGQPPRYGLGYDRGYDGGARYDGETGYDADADTGFRPAGYTMREYDVDQERDEPTRFRGRRSPDNLYHQSWSVPYLPNTNYNEDAVSEQQPAQEYDPDRPLMQRREGEEQRGAQQQYRGTGTRNDQQ